MRTIRPISRATPRTDGPSLSKAHFRWQRGWRARVRSFTRIHLPLIVLSLLGWHVAEDDGLRGAIEAQVDKTIRKIAVDSGLAVRSVEILGANSELKALIAGAASPLIGVSSIDLKVKDLHRSIEDMSEIRKARVTLSPTGALTIAVERRRPAAVFRNDGGRLGVVDREGVEIRPVRKRRDEPELILLLGEGATEHVSQALAVASAAQGLRDRLRAMVRVGERRWDAVLDRDMRILLPAKDPVTAMARVADMYRGGLLERDLTMVDMRITERPTLRMPPRAAEARRRKNPARRVEGEDT